MQEEIMTEVLSQVKAKPVYAISETDKDCLIYRSGYTCI